MLKKHGLQIQQGKHLSNLLPSFHHLFCYSHFIVSWSLTLSSPLARIWTLGCRGTSAKESLGGWVGRHCYLFCPLLLPHTCTQGGALAQDFGLLIPVFEKLCSFRLEEQNPNLSLERNKEHLWMNSIILMTVCLKQRAGAPCVRWLHIPDGSNTWVKAAILLTICQRRMQEQFVKFPLSFGARLAWG